MSTWFKIVTVLRLIWQTVLGDLVLGAIRELLTTVGKAEVNRLAEVAKAKVEELEMRYPGRGEGQIKHNQAFQYLKDYCAAQGLTVAGSVLNFLIEAAVAVLPTRISK